MVASGISFASFATHNSKNTTAYSWMDPNVEPDEPEQGSEQSE